MKMAARQPEVVIIMAAEPWIFIEILEINSMAVIYSQYPHA